MNEYTLSVIAFAIVASVANVLREYGGEYHRRERLLLSFSTLGYALAIVLLILGPWIFSK